MALIKFLIVRQIVAYLIFYMLNAKIIKTKLKDLATFLEVYKVIF